MRLNDGRVVPAFMGQALRGEDLTVFWWWLSNPIFSVNIDDQVEGIYRLWWGDYADL